MRVLAKILIARDRHLSPYRGIASFNDLAGRWPVAEKSLHRLGDRASRTALIGCHRTCFHQFGVSHSPAP